MTGVIETIYRQEEETKICCIFQASDPYTLGIQFFSLITTVVIISVMLRFIITHNKHRQTSFGLHKNIFLLISGWSISHLIKVVLNITAYFKFMNTNYIQASEKSQLQLYSSIFSFFDRITTFFILWLILLIPYKWIKATLLLLQEARMTIKHREITQNIFKILKIIKIYMHIRILYIAYHITLSFMIVMHPEKGCNLFSTIVIIVVVCQSLMCLMLYIYGQVQTTKLKQFIPLNAEDYKKLRIEYLLLMVVSVSRCVLNGLFYLLRFIISFNTYDPQPNCLDTTPRNQIIKSLFLFFGDCLMHFLPIIIVLYVYKPAQKENSLLSSKQNISNDVSVL